MLIQSFQWEYFKFPLLSIYISFLFVWAKIAHLACLVGGRVLKIISQLFWHFKTYFLFHSIFHHHQDIESLPEQLRGISGYYSIWKSTRRVIGVIEWEHNREKLRSGPTKPQSIIMGGDIICQEPATHC